MNIRFANGIVLAAILTFVAAVARSEVLLHETVAGNTMGNTTYLDQPHANRNPSAVVLVTPVLVRAPVAANREPALGVWYDSARERWGILRQDKSAMPLGIRFNVEVLQPSAMAYTHNANVANTVGNVSTLDHPQLNGHRENMPSVTQNYNPGGKGGTYNNRSIGVFYAGGRWAVFNQDQSPIPLGAAFNVVISARSVHVASPGNTNGGASVLDVGSADARMIVTPVWNPNDGRGVYNVPGVAVRYDAEQSRWTIVNTDGSALPTGVGFALRLGEAGGSAAQAPPSVVANPPGATSANQQTVITEQAAQAAHPIQPNDLMPEEMANGSFEVDGFAGWQTHGDAFLVNHSAGVPAARAMPAMHLAAGGIGGDYWQGIEVPIGVKGEYWVSSYEVPDTAEPGTRWWKTGTLTSAPFVPTKRILSFLIGGRGKAGVDLQRFIRHTADGDVYKTIATQVPASPVRLQRRYFDLLALKIAPEELKLRKVRLRVLIRDEDDAGGVSVDDFRMQDQAPSTIADSLDPDFPVWGFADTHAHPAHHLGFGGKTIVGKIDGPISEAFDERFCTENHGGLFRVMGGKHHQHMVIGILDEHLPQAYPSFAGWPRFNSKTHQQHHVEWFRRAYDGGLRLLVALGVNNMFWATKGPGIAPGVGVDDESSVLKQIELMKSVAAAHSEWMQIVHSAREAREVILQNKLAVVLGVEMDNFGNFKTEGSPWRDTFANSLPHQYLPTELSTARAVLRDKVAQYKSLGIRQVTPLHYVSGPFGGTAVFRYAFSMVNLTMTGQPYRLKDGAANGYYYHALDELSDWGAQLQDLFGLGLGHPATIQCVDGCARSTINADGLSTRGTALMETLMAAGMLIDSEHASVASAAGMFSIAQAHDYPILSSHTNPAALAFAPLGETWTAWARGPAFPHNEADLNMRRLRAFGTSVHTNLPHEGMLSETGYEKVRASGGTVGVLAYPFRVHTHATRIANDNEGSSKSYAQMYLYSAEKMGRIGVALSTDRGFNDSVGPRFGVWSAFSLKQEWGEEMKRERTRQRYAQRYAPGVKYDVRLRDWNPARFEFGDVGEEEDIWKALAWWEAEGVNPWSRAYDSLPEARRIPVSSDATYAERIRDLVRGLAADSLEQIARDPSRQRWTQLAMFLLKSRSHPNSIAGRVTVDQMRDLVRIYTWAEPIYALWQAREGANAPLRKRIDGNRDWDFNIDGLAHYGMLPDMLQDLRNVGLTASDLTPLFRSAEDYIRMWEKAELASRRIGG